VRSSRGINPIELSKVLTSSFEAKFSIFGISASTSDLV
jgi:hypothetical protein